MEMSASPHCPRHFFDFDKHCLTMVRLAVAQGAEPEEGGRWRSLETPAG